MERHKSNDARKGQSVKGVIFDMGGVIYPHPKQFVIGETAQHLITVSLFKQADFIGYTTRFCTCNKTKERDRERGGRER